MPDDEEEYEDETDQKNDEWFKENFFDLMQQYPREWIAVLDGRVIANGAYRIDVEDKAKAIAGELEYSVYFVPPTGTFTDIGYAQR